MADSRVDFRRKSVTTAQTTARTDMMKRTLGDAKGIRIQRLNNREWDGSRRRLQDIAWSELVCFIVSVNEVSLWAD